MLDHVRASAAEPDKPQFLVWDLAAHKRLPSPLPAGVEMQAAAVDVADDRMATVVCRSTATASGPADSDPLPWRPDVTLWDLEGHRLREFFGPDYRSGPRGDNTELVVDALGLDANYLWWRHFDGRCRWDLSTGKPVRVPSTDDLSQSDEPAADRVLAQLYRQPGGPSESACAKAISPGGRMIAELSYNGLQVCRGQRRRIRRTSLSKGSRSERCCGTTSHGVGLGRTRITPKVSAVASAGWTIGTS